MDGTRAWESVKAQLQLEMPRAAFDTWVRDAEFVSFEGDVLTVSVKNSYAQDWLESRLTSTINRLLIGILNSPGCSISFITSTEELEKEADAPLATDEPVGKNEVDVEATYSSLYDKAVQPDRIIPLNLYFLRHLRRIGPELGLIYVAFKQVAYMFFQKQHGRLAGRFYVGHILKWCGGMSRRTLLKYLTDEKTWTTMKGLLSRDSSGKEYMSNGDSGGFRRLPVSYTVELSLPLTGSDAESMAMWIRERFNRGMKPEEILDSLIDVADRDLEELIPLARNPHGDYPATSILDLLSQIFDQVDANKLLSYATRLENIIMPSSSMLSLSHFFLLHVWPHLNPGQGWIVQICKKRTYKGERDTFVVQRGYREMAEWIGLSETRGAKTVWEWFQERYTEGRVKAMHKGTGQERKGGRQKSAKVGGFLSPVLHVYLKVIGDQRSFGGSALQLQVLQEDLPIEIFDAAINDQAPALADWVENFEPQVLKKNEPGAEIRSLHHEITQFALSGVRSLHYDVHAVCTIGLAQFALDEGAVCTIALTQFALEVGAVCTVKALLTPKTNSINSKNNANKLSLQTQTPAGRAVGGRGYANISSWSMEKLLIFGRIPKKQRGDFDDSQILNYLARLLYALSPAGHGITNPSFWAISDIEETSMASGACLRLATLQPNTLIALADETAHGRSIAMDRNLARYVKDWEQVIGDDQDNAIHLLQLLVGASNVTVERSTTTTETDRATELRARIRKSKK